MKSSSEGADVIRKLSAEHVAVLAEMLNRMQEIKWQDEAQPSIILNQQSKD